MKKGDKIKVKDKGVLLEAVVVEVGTRVLEIIVNCHIPIFINRFFNCLLIIEEPVYKDWYMTNWKRA